LPKHQNETTKAGIFKRGFSWGYLFKQPRIFKEFMG